MPNVIITPKALAIIVLATAGQEVGSFMVQLPEQLLIEALNFAIQYGAIAIGQSVGESGFVDPKAPGKLFVQSVEDQRPKKQQPKVVLLLLF